MDKYDFIIFENYRVAKNHLKDVDIIADYLMSSGYKVAILNIYPQLEYHFVSGAPIITPSHKVVLMQDSSIPLLGRFVNFINQYLWNKHLEKIMQEIEGRYENLYVGSFHTDMMTRWLSSIPLTSSCFFWGLRSYWLQEYKFNRFSMRSINSPKLFRYFRENKNLKFFISDQIIYNEFLKLGIVRERLVIRPERYIRDFCLPQKIDLEYRCTKFLTIGSLRQDKRIELLLDAFNWIASDYKYIIAGWADSKYEAKINLAIGDNPHVNRISHRLSEVEYQSLMKDCDYLIICDVRQYSSVTNGTVSEALLSGKPIVAPNYEPYKSIVEHYKVGFLFNPEDQTSIISAILRAIMCSSDTFIEGLKAFQNESLFTNIVNKFSREIKLSLKKTSEV